MNVFSRSWNITKSTFRIIKNDKKMLLFPLLASICSVAIFLAFVIPFVLADFFVEGAANEAIGYTLLFLFYLAIVFIGTFANVGVVYIAAQSFAGKKATFGKAFGFALKRIHQIFMWSIVAAVVGVLLAMLDRVARNQKGGMGVALLITRSLVGMAWSIATIFVVPVLVYEGTGPFTAIKRSVQTLKKTWGESLVRYIGLGLAQTVFNIIGIVVGVLLIIASAFIFLPLAVVMIIVLICYLIIINYIFSVANAVFNTALYVYAKTGKVPQAYAGQGLETTFRPK